MSIILSGSNTPVTFSGQIVYYDSGTPAPGANDKKITRSSGSNSAITYSSQEVIET